MGNRRKPMTKIYLALEAVVGKLNDIYNEQIRLAGKVVRCLEELEDRRHRSETLRTYKWCCVVPDLQRDWLRKPGQEWLTERAKRELAGRVAEDLVERFAKVETKYGPLGEEVHISLKVGWNDE